MIWEVRRFCNRISASKRILYDNGEPADKDAELNPIISVIHALFVLLSGVFVIFLAKSLFYIAIDYLHPINGSQEK